MLQGEVTSRSTLKIDESPVICGEPARRTDNIYKYHNNTARDGVWDKSVVVSSGNAVRFDMRDSGVVGVLESRVGESGVLSTFRHRIGIDQSMHFPCCIL